MLPNLSSNRCFESSPTAVCSNGGWMMICDTLVRALYLLIGIPVAHISFEFYYICWNRIRLVGNICMLFQEHRLRFNAHKNLFNFRSTSNLLIKNSLSNRLDYSAYTRNAIKNVNSFWPNDLCTAIQLKSNKISHWFCVFWSEYKPRFGILNKLHPCHSVILNFISEQR